MPLTSSLSGLTAERACEDNQMNRSSEVRISIVLGELSQQGIKKRLDMRFMSKDHRIRTLTPHELMKLE